jgi:hypothetical protein
VSKASSSISIIGAQGPEISESLTCSVIARSASP